MKTPRERRSRAEPYTIGKPNIYGPAFHESSSQTESSETGTTENINPRQNENRSSQNPTTLAPVPQEHSCEGCIICFIEFLGFLSQFFSEELTKSSFFSFLPITF